MGGEEPGFVLRGGDGGWFWGGVGYGVEEGGGVVVVVIGSVLEFEDFDFEGCGIGIEGYVMRDPGFEGFEGEVREGLDVGGVCF